MYALGLRRSFVAQHFLVGEDWGPENDLDSHSYKVEIRLEGQVLNEHGYLVDIVKLEDHLNSLIKRYRDLTLNDLAEFAGLNPSIENFARIFCLTFAAPYESTNVKSLTLRLWEDEIAWAEYIQELK